ncbi:hypothetical protein ACIBCH_20475 [Amycolatopsis thailandensis]|uniref:hypothetical protein n=1 Tax=Amycolatopsis thailandensis TaxID=589330 RepID=UPI00378EE6B5
MTRRTPARRLAVYRAWLAAFIACTTVLITVGPVAVINRGELGLAGALHDPSLVVPAVVLLLAWWVSLVGAWTNYDRLPREA